MPDRLPEHRFKRAMDEPFQTGGDFSLETLEHSQQTAVRSRGTPRQVSRKYDQTLHQRYYEDGYDHRGQDHEESPDGAGDIQQRQECYDIGEHGDGNRGGHILHARN